MTRQDRNDDSTRIGAPRKVSPKGIPKNYRASIVILEGYAPGMEYPLEKSSTVIGRDKNADIPIKDELISRQHAAIVFDNGTFLLKDLGSTNGTFLKGGAIERVALKHRDKFTIGNTTIQFILEKTLTGNTYEVSDEDDY